MKGKKLYMTILFLVAWDVVLCLALRSTPLLMGKQNLKPLFSTSSRASVGDSVQRINGRSLEELKNFTTPYEILYPDFFDDSFNGFDRRIPLFSAIHVLKKALLHLAKSDATSGKILRIEHALCQDTDVLGWFDAQSPKLDGEWLFYMQNQQDSFETASLGSLKTMETTDIWTRMWKLLPQNSQLYGGARFDEESVTGDEWRDFGNSAWTLPAVELRRSVGPCNETLTTVAVHVLNGRVKETLQILERIDDVVSPPIAPTNIPPVLSRNSNYGSMDGQELYESSVEKALEQLNDPEVALEKVVLARRQRMVLGLESFSARMILKRWKYGGGEGGHVFYVRPQDSTREFFGCTPERLFRVTPTDLQSEALAGTRPRGSTPKADAALLQELVDDPKDRRENQLTGSYIEGAFEQLASSGVIEWTKPASQSSSFFVRRLLHLQHICQSYSARTSSPLRVVAREVFDLLHPTPAVCGVPLQESREFIRSYESIGFDRGWYAGPLGRLGPKSVEIVVAIRSGLVETRDGRRSVSAYAGAGIVPGSSLQSEWAETNYKFGVLSSCFPQAPISLSSVATPNAAWANGFVEELVRNGVTMFYVCPGSRSTPLVVAIAKAARYYVGIIRAVSVHDERAAAFRALGYGRGHGRPAAVITSSGTAVSNLYPAVVEAGTDGVPMILLTADRPYEARDSGANQSIDQVKHFGSSYVRWFRDVLPPSHDVPISVALSDACHAVTVAREQRGPVHVNIQFRENLAPDTGRIRGDDRVNSKVSFDSTLFTDGPGIARWSKSGDRFLRTFLPETGALNGVQEISRLIHESKRGIIVVGNLRSSVSGTDTQDGIVDTISEFAKVMGFPVFAGAQSAMLRFKSSAVVPFGEHVLKTGVVKENIKPDLIVQIGAPLVSTEVHTLIASATNREEKPANHILLHPHRQNERADPSFTVSHRVNADIKPFLVDVLKHMDQREMHCSSELVPLIALGRRLQKRMKSIITESSRKIGTTASQNLSEPEIILALAESDWESSRSLFLSSSMPVRDADFFLYPYKSDTMYGPRNIGANRGASGIDGILSSAFGFAEATKLPTTLVVGDVATLHDISSMHSLATDSDALNQNQNRQRNPLTSIIVNNDGGGIFSFLPIAKYGSEVAFDDFFGTPTSTFSFEEGAAAFGLPLKVAADYDSFRRNYSTSLSAGGHNIIEARVMNREANVLVHREICSRVDTFIRSQIEEADKTGLVDHRLPIDMYGLQGTEELARRSTLVLLHGWMGEKAEWARIAEELQKDMPGWTIIAMDLPGHGEAPLFASRERQTIQHMLGIAEQPKVDISSLAASALASLRDSHGVDRIDAIAGYSLGGRVALTMRDLDFSAKTSIFHEKTKVILLSASAGQANLATQSVGAKIWESSTEDIRLDEKSLARVKLDESRAIGLISTWNKLSAQGGGSLTEGTLLWQDFISTWYSNPIWGELQEKKSIAIPLFRRRSTALSIRGYDMAEVLRGCTPPMNPCDFAFPPESTIFVAGEDDDKYSKLVQEYRAELGILTYSIVGAGHALMLEAPLEVANILKGVLSENLFVPTTKPSPNIQRHTMDENDKGTMTGRKESMESLVNVGRLSRSPAPAVKAASSHAGALTITEISFASFAIGLTDGESRGVAGIGWGANASALNSKNTRSGFIIEVRSLNPAMNAVGEVSPLVGLHKESVDEVEKQLVQLQEFFLDVTDGVTLGDSTDLLSLNGQLSESLNDLAEMAGINFLCPSLRFGLESVILSLASQLLNLPMNIALQDAAITETDPSYRASNLAVNGLVARGEFTGTSMSQRSFPSIKVKVGHATSKDDDETMRNVFQINDIQPSSYQSMIRADANRAWSFQQATEFVTKLDGLGVHGLSRIEFIEEPLKKLGDDGTNWTINEQIEELERWYSYGGVPYALDESLVDLLLDCNGSFDEIKSRANEVFRKSSRGCAAFVLKPALLGAETSFRLARLAREEYGIAAVFSSSFDSGVGLAYTAILADLSNKIPSTAATRYAHGIGTFQNLEDDTLSPPFESYLNKSGFANVASLARGLYGLQLSDIYLVDARTQDHEPPAPRSTQDTKEDDYEASSSTSGRGNEIGVVVTLPLPFSATDACARFTDLPQQPRWSPWISSVECQGNESRWKVNVRGISLTWKATSEAIVNPWPGIRWESISGLRNSGQVQFIPSDDGTCQMNVKMSIVPPRILQPLFKGTSVFIEDFLRDKLLKWSLEMFRDVVKADLAIERGDVELGDALFGAVEGKASAIEATLNITPEGGRPDDSR